MAAFGNRLGCIGSGAVWEGEARFLAGIAGAIFASTGLAYGENIVVRHVGSHASGVAASKRGGEHERPRDPDYGGLAGLSA